MAPVYVAFPAVAEPWPDPDLFPSEDDFYGVANRREREWIYHLQVRTTNEPTHSIYPEVNDTALQALSDRLGLPARASGGLRLEPREFLHDLLAKWPGEYSDWAVGLPAYLVGWSYELAVAIGLLAATNGQPLPPDVLFSGAFGPESLDLLPVDQLGRKLTLALGAGGCHAAINHLTNRLYEHSMTSTVLGPQEVRVRPGGVRLFVVSGNPDRIPADPDAGVVYEPLDHVTVSCVGQWIDEERAVADSSLLMAVVTHLADAAALVGLPPTGRVGPPTGRRVRFFRVSSNNRPRYRGYWDDRVNSATEIYDWFKEQAAGRAGDRTNYQEELERLIQLLMHEVNTFLGRPGECFAGDLAVQGDDPDWLDVVARVHAGQMPRRYPATLGISSRVMRYGQIEIVADSVADPDFQEAASSNNPASRMYPGAEFESYMRFLAQVKGVVKLPIKGPDGRVAAVIALHVKTPNVLPSEADEIGQCELGGVLKRIARLAEPTVSWLRAGYTGQVTEAFPIQQFDFKQIDTRIERRHQKLLQLGDQLVRWACRSIPGVCRSLLRIVGPNRNYLLRSGMYGYTDEEPDDQIPVDEETASGTAVICRRSQWYEDTERQYQEIDGVRRSIHYKRVAPEARAVAAILIEVDGYVVGVLNLDWEYRRPFPLAFRRAIEEALAQPARVLKSFLVDAEFNELEQRFVRQRHADQLESHLATESTDPGKESPERLKDSEPLYQDVLEALVRIVGGGQYAMLFLRDPDTGCYKPAAAHGHSPEWRTDPQLERGFPYGVGMIGWVAKHRRAIRICDLREELSHPDGFTSVDRDEPPRWENLAFFDREFGDGKIAYLAVPIVAGREVSGVLRFVHTGEEFQFDPFIVYLVSEAANRLGAYLFERTARRVERARETVFWGLPGPRSVDALARFYLDHLSVSGCLGGRCQAAIRLLDDLVPSVGPPVPVLRRLACTTGIGGDRDALFRTEDSPGLSAAVLRTGDEVISLEGDRDKSFQANIRMDQDSLVRARCQRYPSGVGLPLRSATGELIGTLYAARQEAWAFTETEIARLRTLAQVIGKELAQAEEDEFAVVSSRLTKSVLADLTKYQACLKPRGLVMRTVKQWLGFSAAYLRVDRCGLLVRKYSIYVRADGQFPIPDYGDLPDQLGGQRWQVVCHPDRDSRLLQLLKHLGQDVPDELVSRHRAVLSIGKGETPRFLFGFLGNPDSAISVRRVRKLQEYLDILVPLLRGLRATDDDDDDY